MKGFIEKAVDYIEEHLTQHLTVEDISDYIGYSKYYMNRLFQVYTGLSLIEYTRKRKLNVSLKDLYANDRIIDIAFKYGYSSERAYSRAFLAEFGSSPSQVRKNPIKPMKKLAVYDIQVVLKKGLEKMKDYISEVKYVTLEEMTVVSGIEVGPEPEDAIISKMNQFRKKNQINVIREFGFDSPVETEDPEKFRGYEYWLVTNDDVTEYLKGTDFKLKTIPSYKYVSLRITEPFADPFNRIGGGWKALVSWLEDNKVQGDFTKDDHLDCLEEVLEENGVMYMDIFIPISRG